MLQIEIDPQQTKLLPVRDYNTDELKIVEHNELDYKTFFEQFLLQNIPCVVKNVTSSWKCDQDWINNNVINYDYFDKVYGDLEAPIADCDNLSYNAHCKTNMKIKDFMNYLRNSQKDKLLYLKDWHLRRLCPNDLFYVVPQNFASDWLNEFATDREEDDFMFVYIGPQRSWTPLHVDVYNSYSWSVNVIGRKKWTFFPPGEENKFKDSAGNLPLWFTENRYPNVKYIEIIQEKGDALFVPSGWHHQVENLLDTISINHNWVNACNIEAVWLALLDSLETVENEIKDLKNTPEFTIQCQLILKSLFGMNFADFVDLLTHIGKNRIKQFRGDDFINFNIYKLGINHVIFDLRQLHKIMNLIQDHHLFLINFLSYKTELDFIDTKNCISQLISL